nr:MAG TPA: hypothetical protein [Caudoviricetes sp.]
MCVEFTYAICAIWWRVQVGKWLIITLCHNYCNKCYIHIWGSGMLGWP